MAGRTTGTTGSPRRIRRFDALVTFSDKQEDAGGQRNDLRPEAVQYIAISFADPWEAASIADPAKSIARADSFYQNRTERHVRDVYEQLGDTLRLSAGMPSGGEVPPEIKAAYLRRRAWATRCRPGRSPRNPRSPELVDDAGVHG